MRLVLQYVSCALLPSTSLTPASFFVYDLPNAQLFSIQIQNKFTTMYNVKILLLLPLFWASVQSAFYTNDGAFFLESMRLVPLFWQRKQVVLALVSWMK